MAIRERVEYDIVTTGGRQAEAELSRVDRAVSRLTDEQAKNVKASKAFAQAHDEARAKAVVARRAELSLADARDRLTKVTKAGGGTERDRAKALLAVEAAELRAGKAVRVAAGAHRDADKAFRRAAAGADDVEKQTTRAGRAMSRFGTAARAAGKGTSVGFAGVSKTVGGVRLGLGGIFKGMAIGVPVVGALAVGLGALGKAVLGGATRLDLMERKARTVYGKALPQVAAWSDRVAERAGMTTREMTGLGASFADMLKPMGFTTTRAASLSTRFAQMAPILAEWSAGQFSVADTSEALMGALTGEYDTLQRLGIPISDAAVQAELLRRGQDKLTGSALSQAKATAALDIIYRGSTDAQKNYAKGADSLAAKQAIATAKFKEVRDAILSALLPALSRAGDWFLAHQDDIIDWGFQAAASVVRFGTQAGQAFGDFLIGVGHLAGGLTDLLEGSDATWIGIARGAAMVLGIINPTMGAAARNSIDSFERMRKGAADKLHGIETKAITAGETLKTATEKGGTAALIKLEQVRRAALRIPDKTLTELQVDERSAQAKIADIRKKLRDPELTKTRRAKLEADLKKWGAQLRQIRRDKELASRAIIVPAGARGVPSRVRVVRVDSNRDGMIDEVRIGGSTFGRAARAAGGPIIGPGTATSDSIVARLSTGEHVLTAREVTGFGGHSAVERMRKIAASRAPGFAFGGAVTDMSQSRPRAALRRGVGDAAEGAVAAAVLSQIAGALIREGAGAGNLGRALAFARMQAGKPYLWGGVGPAGYDCSGFQSAITNVALGQSPYQRRFATGSFPAPGWQRGPGPYMVGFFRGNPGHMAGTLLGVNVESRGGDGVVVGGSARGARSAMFGGNVYHLVGAGGRRRGDDPAFDSSPRAGRTIRMAGGGVIREPVIGWGRRTGYRYDLAERGPETVTPGTRGGGTTVNVFTIGQIDAASLAKIRSALREAQKREGRPVTI